MNKASRFIRCVGFAWLLPLVAAPALAAIPQTLNYQGSLTNNANQPVEAPAAAPLQMTFKFFAALTGGAELYAEQQSVVVRNGVFNVQIGSVTALTLPFDVPYFLEITIGALPNAETLNPRQPLASAAYAFRTGCIPGDRVTCFSFPTGTPGVGPCKTGIRVCNAQGTGFGSCVGEVGPNCNSLCVDLGTDNNNCGVCGNTCVTGNTCGGGGTPGICGHLMACGNGFVEAAESCDDGNAVSGDGCSTACQIESGFSCSGSPSVCTTLCGDGIPAGVETCDDGNQVNGDGCTNTCQVEADYTCNGSPSICTKRANGSGCGTGAQCQSGFCVDSVCSNSACSNVCFAANLTGSVGTCTPVPSGLPDNNPVCNSATQACNGAGQCLLRSGAACTSNQQCISALCTPILGTCF